MLIRYKSGYSLVHHDFYHWNVGRECIHKLYYFSIPLFQILNVVMNMRQFWKYIWNEWTDGRTDWCRKKGMNEWMNEWMNERTNERTDERTNERMNERTHERTNECMKMCTATLKKGCILDQPCVRTCYPFQWRPSSRTPTRCRTVTWWSPSGPSLVSSVGRQGDRDLASRGSRTDASWWQTQPRGILASGCCDWRTYSRGTTGSTRVECTTTRASLTSPTL